MFDNMRLVTHGANETLSPALQHFLWYLVENMEVREKDYLQVFELYEKDGVLTVHHSQECPPYSQTHALPGFDLVSVKIYVIDDQTHSTMLLASEY